MKNRLLELNSARFGSFSEFLFENSIPYEKIERKHFEQCDFLWNDIPCDIKGRRLFNNNYKNKPNEYHGKKIIGIEYILIEFYNDVVVISKDKKELKLINYDSIEKMYTEWYSNKMTKPNTILKRDLTILNSLKQRIQIHFNSLNFKVKIIYRTTQKDWGNESPSNLLPKRFIDDSITVFLNFKDFNINENNIEEVIAFKDSDAENFSLIPNPKLHKQKIDLSKIDSKYKFKDIDELINNWAF